MLFRSVQGSLKYSVRKQKFEWTHECQEPFDKLK